MTLGDSITHLLGKFPAMQQLAIFTLSRSGPAGIPLLLEQFEKTEDPEILARIGWALQEVLRQPSNREKSTLLRLARYAESGSYDQASNAITCLMEYRGDLDARATFARIASGSNDSPIRVRALGAYIAHSDKSKAEIPFIKSFLDDASDDVRIYAAGGLGLLGDKSGMPLVLKMLQNHSAPDNRATLRLQRLAIIAASDIGDSSLIPTLKDLEIHSKGKLASKTRPAIAEIELKNLPNDEQKILYLKAKLAEKGFDFWAGLRLGLVGTSAAEAALKSIADSDGHPGQSEARRHYAILIEKRSGDQK